MTLHFCIASSQFGKFRLYQSVSCQRAVFKPYWCSLPLHQVLYMKYIGSMVLPWVPTLVAPGNELKWAEFEKFPPGSPGDGPWASSSCPQQSKYMWAIKWVIGTTQPPHKERGSPSFEWSISSLEQPNSFNLTFSRFPSMGMTIKGMLSASLSLTHQYCSNSYL
jgi:hypothetical protein